MVQVNRSLSEVSASDWVDISYPLSTNMLHLPYDSIPPHIDWVFDPAIGSSGYMMQYMINTHHGTHVEAPRHFDPDGTCIDEMPVNQIWGPCRVIQIDDNESIKREDLEQYDIKEGEIILVKTINSSYWKRDRYIPEYVYFTPEAADYLIQRRISVIGHDYLNIGKDGISSSEEFCESDLIRKSFHEAGIWILGSIDLYSVEPGEYEILCMPLKITGADAAPARALLRKI